MQNSILAMLAASNGNVFRGVVQKSYGGHSEPNQTLNFRLFALLTRLPGGKWSCPAVAMGPGLCHDRNILCTSMQKQIHLFSRVRNGLRMMVSGLNHLLGRVKRSDLVQSGRDTSPDAVGGLTLACE